MCIRDRYNNMNTPRITVIHITLTIVIHDSHCSVSNSCSVLLRTPIQRYTHFPNTVLKKNNVLRQNKNYLLDTYHYLSKPCNFN